ncbi:MAG: hypothetical protein ACYTAN_16855, partial [Planctomycetota bacterium]
LVDTAIDILVGYHLLHMAEKSRRKLRMARHFIPRAVAKIRTRTRNVTSGDSTVLRHFEEIAGEPTVEV